MIKGHKIVTIGDVCLKGSSNVSQNKLLQNEGIYPIFGASGFIKNVDFYHQEKKYLSIVKDGSGVGRVTKMDAKTSVIGTLQYLIPKDNIDIDYLYYSLIKVDFKKFVSGAAIPHIYFKDYQKEPFYLVPPTEQKAIVEKLDFAFDAIEKAKANIEKNIENAKELFQSKLNEIFSQKGEGNKKWVFKKLSDIFDVRDGTHDSPKYQESGFALVTSKNLKKGKITLDKIKFISEKDFININKRSNVSKGDILFAMIGTIGNPVVIMEEPDFAIKNVALIKSNKENNSYFFSYYLDLEMVIKKMQDESKGTTQRFVSLGYMRNFEVPCPKIEIQNKIVKQIDLLSEQTNLLQEKYKQKLANLEELKKSILEKAFKGELI